MVAEQNGFLAVSANRLPALANAQKSLAATTDALRLIEAQIQARESSGNQLVGDLRDLLTAGEARQNAIEAQLKFINTEGARWRSYYDARLNRAQTECAITNPGAGAPRATPGSKAGMKK